jgi:hypothetical protein
MFFCKALLLTTLYVSFCLFVYVILLLYWGYIVTFTKFLQYMIVAFTLSSFSFIPLLPHSWNSFNRSHFSIFIHEYIIFLLYSPSYTLSFVYFFVLMSKPPLLSTTIIILYQNLKRKILSWIMIRKGDGKYCTMQTFK